MAINFHQVTPNHGWFLNHFPGPLCSTEHVLSGLGMIGLHSSSVFHYLFYPLYRNIIPVARLGAVLISHLNTTGKCF